MNVYVKYNDLNYIDITFNSGHDKMIYIYIYIRKLKQKI